MADLHSNSVVLKVLNGTQRSDVNLCTTCACAHVLTVESGQRHIRCNQNYQNPLTLRQAVTQCSGYLDRTRPSLQQMQDIAWTLMTDKGGRKVGFARPERHDTPLPPVGF